MIQYIIHFTYLEWISCDQSDSNLFPGYSLLDVLGLDGLEAVVGRVEGGKEKPDKGVDRTGHLEMRGNVRFGQNITLEHVYELYNTYISFVLFCHVQK